MWCDVLWGMMVDMMCVNVMWWLMVDVMWWLMWCDVMCVNVMVDRLIAVIWLLESMLYGYDGSFSFISPLYISSLYIFSIYLLYISLLYISSIYLFSIYLFYISPTAHRVHVSTCPQLQVMWMDVFIIIIIIIVLWASVHEFILSSYLHHALIIPHYTSSSCPQHHSTAGINGSMSLPSSF